MYVKALKAFSNPTFGNKVKDDKFHVADAFGRQLIEWGMVVEVEAEKKRDPSSGTVKPVQSSPVDQALHLSNAITSKREDGEQSQSTQVGDSPRGSMSSMDATDHGGRKTGKKRRGRPPGSRKTETPT